MSGVQPTKPFLQTIAFVGNPNSGKTTLYNSLTGSDQKTGNFCGVTVESVAAECSLDSEKVQLVDLPGIYTLTQISNDDHEDERITRQFLDDGQCDLLVNVVDSLNLERSLYLTLQCLELGLPMIVVLTRSDLAQKKHIQFNSLQLEKALKCPVIQVSAKTQLGMEELKAHLFKKVPQSDFCLSYPAEIESSIETLIQKGQTTEHPQSLIRRDTVIRWLEGESTPNHLTNTDHQAVLTAQQDQLNFEPDVQIAKTRYDFIENVLAKAMPPSSQLFQIDEAKKRSFEKSLDKVLCHKWLGLPCFLGIMYALFFFAMNIGGAFQDSVEQLSTLFLVDGISAFCTSLGLPEWLVYCCQGVGTGISTVITFVPVIGAMYFALSFLEVSGYMSRAAIVMDRIMQFIGLPGKSFVPMIIGFGCNVPAILGARSLDHKRDKILTVMMSPFMSCGARLAIFTVFVSIFFQNNGHNIVFLLYLIGILMAVFTGLLLKKTLLNGPVSPLIMELPAYTLPSLKQMLRTSWHRLYKFLYNATKLIVPVCMVITVMNSIHISKDAEPSSSVLAIVGQKATPLFYPMGLTDDNWPATVGLFTGILAKEVVIGSLNTLYSQTPQSEAPSVESGIEYWSEVKSALATIPENLLTLRGAFSNPISAQAPEESLDHSAHQEMLKRFASPHAAFAYLIFILLYFPCVSATAAMVKEVKSRWTIFSVCWTTLLAYFIAVFYYQISQWPQYPMRASLWCVSILGGLLLVVWGIHRYSQSRTIQHAVPTKIVLNQS